MENRMLYTTQTINSSEVQSISKFLSINLIKYRFSILIGFALLTAIICFRKILLILDSKSKIEVEKEVQSKVASEFKKKELESEIEETENIKKDLDNQIADIESKENKINDLHQQIKDLEQKIEIKNKLEEDLHKELSVKQEKVLAKNKILEFEKIELDNKKEKIEAEKTEFKSICKKINMKPEHIGFMYIETYERIKSYDRLRLRHSKLDNPFISLRNYCKTDSKGNIYACNILSMEALAKILTISNRNHPLSKKAANEIIYIEKADPLFESVKSKCHPIPGLSVEGMVIDERHLNSNDMTQIEVSRKEIEEIYSKSICSYEHVITTTPEEYKDLKSSLSNVKNTINLNNYCIIGESGNAYFCSREAFELYSIAKIKSNNSDHPLKNHDIHFIEYIDSTDAIFENLQGKGFSIPGMKIGAVVIDSSEFANILEKRAIMELGEGAEIKKCKKSTIEEIQNKLEQAKTLAEKNHKKEIEHASEFDCYRILSKCISTIKDSDELYYYIAFKKGAYIKYK